MATSDFDEDDIYDDEQEDDIDGESDGSISSDIQDVKNSYKDLENALKEYKDGPANQTNQAQEAREFNQQMQNKNKARSNGADELSKQAGQNAGNQVGTEVAKEATTKAGTQVATTSSSAATSGASATGATAAGGTAAAGSAAATGVSATVVGAIVVAALSLLKSIKKLQDRLDKKAAENGLDIKTVRKMLKASPLILIITIVTIITIIILFAQGITIEKADSLKQAIECAESSGCTDFMNTGVTISSASVPLGGISSTIVAFAGEQLSAAEKKQNDSFLTTLNTVFDSATSKKLIYFTDLQIAKLVIEYLMFENKYYGFTGTMNQIMTDMTKQLAGATGEEKDVIEWLFQLLVKYTIIGDIYEAYSLFNWLKLEKVAFNKIEWTIIHTGVSGTGVGFFDDTLNNYCKDTEDWWRTDALKNFCNESKETESFTFKVVGDINPFTSMLWVPTDIWTVGDSAANSLLTAFRHNQGGRLGYTKGMEN